MHINEKMRKRYDKYVKEDSIEDSKKQKPKSQKEVKYIINIWKARKWKLKNENKKWEIENGIKRSEKRKKKKGRKKR
jgi:hypothetical protein